MPPPLAADPGVSRVGLGAGVVAAGIAASAAGYAMSRTGLETSETNTPPEQEPLVVAEGLADRTQQPPLDMSPAGVAALPPGGSIPDLEEELARALAEPEVVPSFVAERDKSLASGLADLLARPKSRKRTPVLEPEAGHEHESEPEAGTAPQADAEVVSDEASLAESVAETGADAIAADDRPDPAVEPGDTLERLLAQTTAAETEDRLAATSLTAHATDAAIEADLMGASPDTPAVASRKVLGTYNAGGRTYSMYGDGSVEAHTEFGVERFSSMDELRRHLVRT
jgi:hypothetical protein